MSATEWEALSSRYGDPDKYLTSGYLNAGSPIPTNIPPLDEALCGGLRPGMHVLGGEPGAGKSALGLFISLMSALSGARVMFLSLEMSANQCWGRCLSCVSLATDKPFRWGDAWRMGAKERERQAEAMRDGRIQERVDEFMRSDPVALAAHRIKEKCPGLLIADGSDVQGIDDITRRAAEWRRAGVSLLVVDYLQYIGCEGITDEYNRVSSVSKKLNMCAVELGMPILALASNNRASGSGKPSMHSFKGSGDIEYHALSAWVLERDAEDAGARTLHVVKNRFGSTISDGIRLAFDGAHNSFSLDGSA